MMNIKNNKKEIKNILYTNKNIGFSISIPDNWTEVKKSSYEDLGINDNTLFIFVVNKFTSLTAVFSGFSQLRSFNKFFSNFDCNDKYKVIHKEEIEINKINVKQIVIETNTNKIMHNFCLINGMIINFTINVDIKNKIFDKKGIVNDLNFKQMNQILNTIKIFEPINPPVYIEDTKEEVIVEKINKVEDKKIEKTLAQLLVEKDCQYKHILIPDLYLKYTYNKDNQNTNLNIINNEIYFKGVKDNFKLIKVDQSVLNEIERILHNNMNELSKMNIKTKTNSKSTLLIKMDSNYSYIDLNNTTSKLYNMLECIIKEIKEHGDIDLTEQILLPVVENEKEDEFTVELIEETKEDKTTVEPTEEEKENEFTVELIEETKEDEITVEPTEEEKEDEFTVELIEETKEDEITVEPTEEEKEDEFTAELIEENKEEDIVVPVMVNSKETEENKVDIPNINVEESTTNYNLEEFQEFFHNVDGHASFRFIFPSNIGEKIIRDFNVFDIVNYNQLVYRIFLFKCETEEKYIAKLQNWMDKNISSNKTTLQNSYTTNNNGFEIKTYILENDKFYKVVYVYGYLIAISGYNDEDSLALADIALKNVEIGEDEKEFVEAHDRKMRSINILQAQEIPYIDELPTIKSSYEVTGKTLDEIAKRAIVLCICCNFASDIVSNKKKRYIKESKKFFNKLLDTFNVKDVMTKDEKLLFDKMNKDLAIQISWQFESYVILLWTLGLIDDVTFPDTLVEPDSVTAIVSACDNYREFIGKCQLRNVYEVLDLADLTYRYNWYCVESKINDEEPIINPEIVMERHRAFNWLLSNEKWDKIEINT